MGGSTKCFSIGDEGSMCPRRGRDGRAGTFRSELGPEDMGLITDPEAKITKCGGWIKIKGSGSSNWSRIWVDELQNGKDKRKRPDTFRIIHLLKVSALCFLITF